MPGVGGWGVQEAITQQKGAKSSSDELICRLSAAGFLCALIEEGKSSAGFTFQATRGNPNTSISHQKGGGWGWWTNSILPSAQANAFSQVQQTEDRMEREQSEIRWMKNEGSVLSENNRQTQRQESNKQANKARTAVFCFALIRSQDLGVCCCTKCACLAVCACVCESVCTIAAELLCLSV